MDFIWILFRRLGRVLRERGRYCDKILVHNFPASCLNRAPCDGRKARFSCLNPDKPICEDKEIKLLERKEVLERM